MKSFVLVALTLGACDTVDDRPETLQYINATILQPTCAKAQCHSSFKREVGDDYSSVEEARFTIIDNGQAPWPAATNLAGPTEINSTLVSALTTGVTGPISGDQVRMPYDEPMPAPDIRLIEKWVAGGLRGAQCLPAGNGLGCLGPGHPDIVIECDDDGNVLQDAPVLCVPGAMPDTCAAIGQECVDGICMPVHEPHCGQGTACVEGSCQAVTQ